MTSARIVRLLVIPAVLTGAFLARPSLLAQSRGDARQYNPAFDGAANAPDDGAWDEVPAYVSALSGDAKLERDGDVTSDFEQVPLQVGDRLRTTRGRVEVLYSDGSVIALDEYSAASVDAEHTWRLHTGRMKVISRGETFTVDSGPLGVARLRSSGDYHVTVAVNRRGDPEVELAVVRGSGELENRLGRTLVRAGTRALTTESFAPSVPYAFEAPRDEFERWTASLEADRYGAESSSYLPVELRAYGGAFDRDGYWGRHNTYGWVWYPRVAVGWEPFRSGRWSFVVGFGYNWIGGSRWEWPTHYYGRWDRYGSHWFWVPSRPVVSRRIGYAAPRRSLATTVNYYVRPTPPAPQKRTAIPRSSGTNRDARPPVFQSDRTASAIRPTAGTGRITREAPPTREPRPPERTAPPQRERRPDPPSRPSTSVDTRSRPERPQPREAPPSVGRLPDPARSSTRAPEGGRTPSTSSSRPSSSGPSGGGAVRRGGGRH